MLPGIGVIRSEATTAPAGLLCDLEGHNISSWRQVRVDAPFPDCPFLRSSAVEIELRCDQMPAALMEATREFRHWELNTNGAGHTPDSDTGLPRVRWSGDALPHYRRRFTTHHWGQTDRNALNHALVGESSTLFTLLPRALKSIEEQAA